ncbi:MAG: YccT family protein [Marinobacter sp.]
MNPFVKLITVALFLAPGLAFSEVTLELGHCLNVHVVDGRDFEGKPSSPLVFEDGTHQLVVDCSLEIGRSSEEALFETSEAFVIRFDAADADLRLSAPEINSALQLEEFNHSGNFQLRTKQNRSIEFTADVLEKEGYQIFRNYREELQAFNRSASPAAVPQMSSKNVPGASNGVEPQFSVSGESPDQEMVIQMLRYWYLKADKKTRNELESWIRSSK